LLPAFNASCKTENREQQTRNLHLIRESGRQGDRSRRVLQAQLNPEREKNWSNNTSVRKLMLGSSDTVIHDFSTWVE